ncbi:MAG: YXWGXW repeat-containing protein [Burkholderiaceae bacterium]|nr:YXWGXW repeat-containing protein [Pseudomonadota bacterium]MBS0597675.1 YXWGXW repeat-containing protein [Pseudomonadota bacterium]MCO5115730.1 hypothetical protein [Burkholderiaceae bacterium]MCP5219403.1 YXWGXW repeat-containing protein [Burkholderiaceae bacterium]
MPAFHSSLSRSTLRWGAALLAAGALLGGCAVVPAPVAVADGDVYATVAPPPPPYEVVPAVPYVGAVWIGGYWNWYGGRHVWVPGRYVRPRPGYHWEPHHWEHGPRGGWALRGGHWVR